MKAKVIAGSKSLYRRSGLPAILRPMGIHRKVSTLTKEHSQGVGVPVAAWDGRHPLFSDEGIVAYARSRLSAAREKRALRPEPQDARHATP